MARTKGRNPKLARARALVETFENEINVSIGLPAGATSAEPVGRVTRTAGADVATATATPPTEEQVAPGVPDQPAAPAEAAASGETIEAGEAEDLATPAPAPSAGGGGGGGSEPPPDEPDVEELERLAKALKAARLEVSKRELKGVQQVFNWLAVALLALLVPLLAWQDPQLTVTAEEDGEAAQEVVFGIGWAIFGAAFATIAVLLVLSLIRKSDFGLINYILGDDGRISTSKLQVALWTVAVSFAFLLFVGLELSDDSIDFATVVGDDLSEFREEYLLLLGGPFAAAVLSKTFTTRSLETGVKQKVDTTQTMLTQAVKDDAGQGDLVDAQFLAFNLVALAWFAGALVSDPGSLPAIPSVLVGLTSVSALTYAAAKATERNQPIISSATRVGSGPIRAGDQVEIRGMNLIPAGGEVEENRVGLRVKAGETTLVPDLATASASSMHVLLDIAPVTETQPVSLVVVTPAGAETDPYVIQVAPDQATITSVDPPELTPGGTVVIRGNGLRRPGAERTAVRPIVEVNDIPVETDVLGRNRVRVHVPEGLAGPTATLSIQSGPLGGVSEVLTLPVRDP